MFIILLNNRLPNPKAHIQWPNPTFTLHLGFQNAISILNISRLLWCENGKNWPWISGLGVLFYPPQGGRKNPRYPAPDHPCPTHLSDKFFSCCSFQEKPCRSVLGICLDSCRFQRHHFICLVFSILYTLTFALFSHMNQRQKTVTHPKRCIK